MHRALYEIYVDAYIYIEVRVYVFMHNVYALIEMICIYIICIYNNTYIHDELKLKIAAFIT